MLPVPTIADLAQFTGRTVDSYSAFADQTLTQATLLFSIVTRLQEMPTEPDMAALAMNAILEMADRMYLEQGYAETIASPFQSETIGSYSYSKSSTAVIARTGQTTGLFWWDLAVDELSVTGTSSVVSGSVGGFEDRLGVDPYTGRLGVPSATDGVDDPPYIRIS